jgi:MYXO-CTERM domain-containing protein
MRLFCLVLAALSATPVSAQDTWTDPFAGIRRLHRRTSNQDIQVLVVDLCAAGVSVRATADGERRRVVSSFGRLVGAQAAVNGDFFSFETYSTNGPSASGGVVWGGADHDYVTPVAFGLRRVSMAPHEATGGVEPWMQEIVSGHPTILAAGTVRESGDPLCTNRHPRTALGLSADRRTLFVAVVDGRATSRIGMRCDELAVLLRDLGAHDATNMDGGGSSTMWLAGTGVVNHPSDGSERVVANHLAILAAGSGAAPHCPEPPEDELLLEQPGAYAPPSTTDLDGDRRADLCARGYSGLRCWRANGTGWDAPTDAIPWGNTQGWDTAARYASIRMGDLDGDGRADACARGENGLECALSTGSGFAAPSVWQAELTDASGWRESRFFTTLRLADVDGDGDDDLCARDADGFSCWISDGSRFGTRIEGPRWSDDSGWSAARHYGTIRTGDVDRDGRADVCGRSASGVECWLSDGAALSRRLDGPAWSDEAGFGAQARWSTIRLADVNGDGRADLCALDGAALVCALSEGESFAAPAVVAPLSDALGFDDVANYATLRTGDVDGNGSDDPCIRSDERVSCFVFDGAAFVERAGPEWSDAAGFGAAHYYDTIQIADVNGDAREDPCTRDASGYGCVLATSDGFEATRNAAGDLSDEGGWTAPEHWTTILLAGRTCAARAEICNGRDDDCDGEVDEPGTETCDGADQDCDEAIDEELACADGGSTPPGDGGASPIAPDGGCGCTSGGPGGAGLFAIVLVLALRRRRS